MARWRIRNPGSFPPDFHRAMRAGVGVDKVVIRCYTRMKAKAWQRDWQVFRYSLRNHPGDPCYRNEVTLMHRTRVHFNHEVAMWELLLTTRESVLQDMTFAE